MKEKRDVLKNSLLQLWKWKKCQHGRLTAFLSSVDVDGVDG